MKRRRQLPRRGAANSAAPGAPTYDDLLQIVHLIQSGSRFSEFRLRSGDIEVDIRRANGVAVPAAPPAAAARAAEPLGGELSPEPASSSLRAPHRHRDLPELPPGAVLVRAPMVGTFYRSPAPGTPPFVEPGSRVAPDTIVCIIEVMKLMNSINAGVAGVVSHILVDDAEPVEYAQALIAIDPDA